MTVTVSSTLVKRIVSLILAGFCLVKVALRLGAEAVPPVVLACVLILSMVWFGEFWATYILPYGWWGRPKPTDLDSPAYKYIIPLFGWIALILLCLAVW